MDRWTIRLTRLMLVCLLIVLVLAQVAFFPVLSGEMAASYPDLAWARWPVLALVIILILGVQVVLWCVWMLLSMVASDTVFSPRAFRYVRLIARIAAVEALLLVGLNAFLSHVLNANPPALNLGLSFAIVAVVLVALLITVMRHLLEKAAGLQQELNEVI